MDRNLEYEFLNKTEKCYIDDIEAYFISDSKLALGAATSVVIKQKVEL